MQHDWKADTPGCPLASPGNRRQKKLCPNSIVEASALTKGKQKSQGKNKNKKGKILIFK